MTLLLRHIRLSGSSSDASPALLSVSLLLSFLAFRGSAYCEPSKQSLSPFAAGQDVEIWVLAGQSNMVGSAPIPPGNEAELAPDPRIFMFNLDTTWMPAQEPLHRHYEALSPIFRLLYRKTPAEWAALAEESRLGRAPYFGYAGPGLFFAKHLAQFVDKPIGLVPTAFGGRPIEDWNPELKDKRGESLYGAILERVGMMPTKIRGLLWYQGESDALDPNRAEVYSEKLTQLVGSLRRDTGIADLPFLCVQIARFAIYESDRDPIHSIEKVREAQRLVATRVKNVFMVSAIDLPLYDHAHLSFEGQQRLGRRLAEVALREVYGLRDHAAPIDFEDVQVVNLSTSPSANRSERQGLRVRFTHVNGRLRASDRPTGFELRPLAGQLATPIIYRVDLEPSGCLLHLNRPMTDSALLYHGAGLMPYVNITDEQDMSIPAFGPIKVTLPTSEADKPSKNQ